MHSHVKFISSNNRMALHLFLFYYVYHTEPCSPPLPLGRPSAPTPICVSLSEMLQGPESMKLERPQFKSRVYPLLGVLFVVND